MLYKVFYVLSEIDSSVLFVENFFFKLRLQLSSFSVLLSEGSQVLERSPISHSHPCLGLQESTITPGPCGLSSIGILLFCFE